MQKRQYPPIPERLKDFRIFLIVVWRALRLPDPTPVQIDMAEWLSCGVRRKIVQAFRGAGKSWITSAYVMWRLRLFPDLKFLVVSAGKERADNFTAFCMRLMERVDILRCMMPDKSGRRSRSSFDTAGCTIDHAPSVKSVGIFGQLTGTRADEIIVDDVETAANALTQSARDRLSEAVKEFDAIIKPGGMITYLGTPQTEQSIYGVLPDRGYTLRIWPARYPDAKLLINYGDALAPKIADALKKDPTLEGKTTDHARFSSSDLAEREISYGKAGFALQFMLDTSLSDAERYPLKLSDLIVSELSKEGAHEKIVWEKSERTKLNIASVGFSGDCFYWAGEESGAVVPYRSRIIAIDPSGRGTDETAYAVLYERDGYLFLMDAGGFSGGYSPDILGKLANIAASHNVNTVIIESNFGDGMFKELLAPVLLRAGVKAALEEVRHSSMKEARIIDTLEPVIAGHRLIVDKKLAEKDGGCTLFYQMTHIIKERGALAHDDRIDALAIATAYWTEKMRQDAEKKAAQRHERDMQKELEVFISGRQSRRNREDLLLRGFTPSITSIFHNGSIKTATKGSA